MKQVINCLKHDNPLINKKLREVSVEEGRTIATELFQILNKRGDGIGLAANQVGIDAQVAVLNVIEPLVLINPKIIRKENEINYYEGCLSFPKKGVHTKRYRTIEITSVGVEGSMIFDGVDEDTLLETICVQHEIDHLMGKTIMDRRIETSFRRDTKKIGRNEIVKLIENGHVVTEMKWKKAQKFLLEDRWELYDDWKRRQ
tara:strand:+ start:1516 stop:2118 length:603 start_codon:yes stop_codon:yes gene_type:complete